LCQRYIIKKSLSGVVAGGLFLDELNSFGAVVEGDEVSASDVEAVEVLDCVFGVVDVFVDDEGSAFFISFRAFADLSYWAESGEDLVELLIGDFVG
jgi:hypothetical protein